MHESLTHIDEQGKASMVDISDKETIHRTAVARGYFVARSETLDAIMRSDLPKGEGLAVARIAGIQAAKQCSTLIPLCHPLPLECVDVTFDRVSPDRLEITAKAIVHGRTGVEMESLTAVSVAALALWDMTKAIDKDLAIEQITLVEKVKKPIS
jgi:cyclic pyranopterin phosphate synthase